MKNIALVTGASSGIGKEFCKQLDSYGLDEIWGIAQNQDKLALLESELKTKVKTISLNLTEEESFVKLQQILEEEKPNIKYLVNCSGFGKFGRYDEIELKDAGDMVKLNCLAIVRMTYICQKYMPKNSNIIEIASVAAFQPVPYIGIYGATKAFVLSFSRSLNVEMKHRNITVTAVCPFWTKTNFFNVAKTKHEGVVSKYTVMYDPEKVVGKALKDAKKGKDKSIYGFSAKLQTWVAKFASHKFVMNFWLNQQKLRDKYKD